MPYTLVSADGRTRFELKDGVALVVGRAPNSDIPVFDPTISRRHAEVQATPDGATVRDLGSSNGTLLNGERVESAAVAAGDTVTFGKVVFTLAAVAEAVVPPITAPQPPVAAGTIVRQVPVRATSLGIEAMSHSAARAAAGGTTGAVERLQQTLAKLLEVSKELGRAGDLDVLLQKIVTFADQLLKVDRAAILLVDDSGELVPRYSRDKRGAETPRAVPQSIARMAMQEKVAIISDDAGGDQRFGGQSIMMQQIRSAICCPLVGGEDRVLGVLYLDNVITSHRFSDHDLDLCVAFAGLAAVALENEQFSQRIRRELVVRSNFERYFAPQLAERIASAPEASRLGGEKRPVAVLFSDVRGFTALAETMRPDDMAALLSEYLSEMVECVFANGGTLDKFIGDAVMAQWGAPIRGEDDPDRAVQAAMDMMRALQGLNVRWRAAGRPTMEMGIGLNYGEAFAGNIGSERRLEFTVIGDTVNTASRLCGAAAGGEILISGSLKDALRNPPATSPCPPIVLKNKTQPVPIFRVLL